MAEQKEWAGQELITEIDCWGGDWPGRIIHLPVPMHFHELEQSKGALELMVYRDRESRFAGISRATALSNAMLMVTAGVMLGGAGRSVWPLWVVVLAGAMAGFLWSLRELGPRDRRKWAGKTMLKVHEFATEESAQQRWAAVSEGWPTARALVLGDEFYASPRQLSEGPHFSVRGNR